MNDYASLVDLAVDSEPAHTIWSVSDLTPLTIDQIQLVAESRSDEFNIKFDDVSADSVTAVELLADLGKPPIVLQARILAALELAARYVLFEDAVEEAGRREAEADEDDFGERADASREESL